MDAITRSLRDQIAAQSSPSEAHLILSTGLVLPTNGMGMDLPMEDRKRVARGVSPRGCPEGRSQLHAEALVEGFDPDVDATVRVQQTVERQVLNAQGEPVEHLVVAGTPNVCV